MKEKENTEVGSGESSGAARCYAEKVLTPCEIEVLLHCYSCGVIHPRIHAPAIQQAINKFFDLECIKVIQDEKGELSHHETTTLGDAWVKSIMSVKMPKTTYMDEHGTIIA